MSFLMQYMCKPTCHMNILPHNGSLPILVSTFIPWHGEINQSTATPSCLVLLHPYLVLHSTPHQPQVVGHALVVIQGRVLRNRQGQSPDDGGSHGGRLVVNSHSIWRGTGDQAGLVLTLYGGVHSSALQDTGIKVLERPSVAYYNLLKALNLNAFWLISYEKEKWKQH